MAVLYTVAKYPNAYLARSSNSSHKPKYLKAKRISEIAE
jgi:hypothetical protein